MLSSTMTIQYVESPSEELMEKVFVMQAELMADDPALFAFVGGDKSLIPILIRSWGRIGLLTGELWTATEADELLGYLLWNPPTSAATKHLTKEERAQINKPLLDALSEEALAYYKPTYYKDFPDYVAKCLAPTGILDVWWLRTAMVRKDKQRQGIARALLEPVRRKAAERNETIACSTTIEHNTVIYAHLGFEVMGPQVMKSPWNEWSLYTLVMKPATPPS